VIPADPWRYGSAWFNVLHQQNIPPKKMPEHAKTTSTHWVLKLKALAAKP